MENKETKLKSMIIDSNEHIEFAASVELILKAKPGESDCVVIMVVIANPR
jgi:hypothetical protein